MLTWKYVKQKKYLIGGVALLLGIFLFVGYLFFGKETPVKEIPNEIAPVESFSSSTIISSSAESSGYVDVKGAVVSPGMYAFTGEMRVWDVIQLAGGFQTEADENQVNFAEILTDQMVVYVPKVGEEIVINQSQQTENGSTDEDAGKELVNINTADQQTLETLQGIGAKKAASIISYRQENGSFQVAEDLKEVSGIGEKIFDGLKDSITVN